MVVIWGGEGAMRKAGFAFYDGNQIKRLNPLGKVQSLGGR